MLFPSTASMLKVRHHAEKRKTPPILQSRTTHKAFQRRPMTLCAPRLAKSRHLIIRANTYHFQRPNPPYPHLELALDTSNIFKLDSFPPAATSWFPPEKEQLLRHSDSVAVGIFIALDVGPQTRKSNAADDGLVGFTSTVAPSVVVVETAISR